MLRLEEGQILMNNPAEGGVVGGIGLKRFVQPIVKTLHSIGVVDRVIHGIELVFAVFEDREIGVERMAEGGDVGDILPVNHAVKGRVRLDHPAALLAGHPRVEVVHRVQRQLDPGRKRAGAGADIRVTRQQQIADRLRPGGAGFRRGADKDVALAVMELLPTRTVLNLGAVDDLGGGCWGHVGEYAVGGGGVQRVRFLLAGARGEPASAPCRQVNACIHRKADPLMRQAIAKQWPIAFPHGEGALHPPRGPGGMGWMFACGMRLSFSNPFAFCIWGQPFLQA